MLASRRWLKDAPEASEIIGERAKPMRFAERRDYDSFFECYNNGWLASQQH
jgi:hypothetical protein